jgi:hypothetical protein
MPEHESVLLDHTKDGEPLVWVAVTHDNRFIGVYAQRQSAEREARTVNAGMAYPIPLDDVEATEVQRDEARAEVERLRSALERIASAAAFGSAFDPCAALKDIHEAARAALLAASGNTETGTEGT